MGGAFHAAVGAYGDISDSAQRCAMAADASLLAGDLSLCVHAYALPH